MSGAISGFTNLTGMTPDPRREKVEQEREMRFERQQMIQYALTCLGASPPKQIVEAAELFHKYVRGEE